MSSTKPHPTAPALTFAWNVRDYSLWRLAVALVFLMTAMSGFFFIFRIVHPVVQRPPVTPQHVISLNPANPAELALIHRAQDRSFALLSDDDADWRVESPLLAFRPSFAGHEIALREPEPDTPAMRQPQLFSATTSVLPPVPPHATTSAPPPPPARLHAIMSTSLARRGAASVALADIRLTEPTHVQYRVAVGSAGQIIIALPLCGVEDAHVMHQLQAAVQALRFTPEPVRRIEWGEITFRWEADTTP